MGKGNGAVKGNAAVRGNGAVKGNPCQAGNAGCGETGTMKGGGTGK